MKINKTLEAAKILFEHKLNKTGLISLNKSIEPSNLDEAYKIQDELKYFYLSLKNNQTLGKKIGVTNKDAAAQVGINEPFYGNLFTRYCDINVKELNSKNFHQPYIEPEIGFRIKNDIDISQAPFDMNNVDDLFDGLVCSIEIVDFRFKKPINEIGAFNLIATNGASDFWIRHEDIYPLNKINLNNHEINLHINSNIHERGNTNKVLKNPINAALWLINTLALKGESMLKGQFISTGSCTKAAILKKNTKIKADFGHLGIIEFKYN
tara:strand:- start:16931 stop:17728 length:798 start_codon:yes stop_codon:yes gene_type:complete